MNYNDCPTVYSHPEVDKLLGTLNFDRDTLLSVKYVLKVLVHRYHFRERMVKDDRYTPHQFIDSELWMPAKFFEYMLSSPLYKTRMTMLVEAGILKAKTRKSPKGRHTLYGLANPKWYREYNTKAPILSPRVVKKITSHSRYRLRQNPHDTQLVIPHIIKNFYRIDLDRKRFDEIWQRRYYTKYLLDHNEYKLTLDEYMQRGEVAWLIINQWNSMVDCEKPKYFTTCGFGRRLHHIYTYLPQEIRPYILDRNGEPLFLIEFDMANCQPTILANLLVLRDPSFRDNLFVQLVESATLYKYIAGTLGIPEGIAKPEMFHMIYCDPRFKTQKLFESLFPEVGREARLLKQMPCDDQGNIIAYKRRYTLLPQMMQRAESTMFRPLWVQLIKQGYKVLPVHDAIYLANISHEQEIEVKKYIEDHIKNYIKIHFLVRPSNCSRMI